MQLIIERKLFEIYNTFQKDKIEKIKRDKINTDGLNERIEAYKRYREEECRLPNGYCPPIVGSLIN